MAAAPELRGVYTGQVEVSIADDFESGVSTTIYRFQQDGHIVSAFQHSTDAPLVRCGDIVRLEGVRLGDTMAVGRAEIARRGTAESTCGTVGTQRVAVILAGFPGSPSLPVTTTAIRRLMFDQGSSSANTWYREKSYGKASLSGEVFGPYTLDRAYSCSETDQMRAATIRAVDREIDFSAFQRYILIFPAIRDCAFSGMATMGCQEIQSNDGRVHASWIWLNYVSDSTQLRHYMIHELGHNFGVGHSRLLRFPGDALEADEFRATPVEYGDVCFGMGQGLDGDFAAAHKVHLKWLDPETDVPDRGE